MKQFFNTVDKDWRSPIADQLATKWLMGVSLVYCIRASANFAFLVKTDDQKYVLRFNHESERSPEFIAGELAYIQCLAECDIRIARPQLSLAGNLIEGVTTAMGVFHGVLFEYLSGERLNLPALNAEAFERWGRMLGQVHRASEVLEINGRPDWSDQIDRLRQVVPKSETAVWKEVDATEEKLHALPTNNANFGLIHFDFELDNLVWADDEIGIFDTDDCLYSWFGMDISNALMSELIDDRLERLDLGDERLLLFLKGYRSAQHLEADEVQRIPLFIRLDNLVSFARVYRSISENPVENEPEWTSILRHKLSRELDKYRDSFNKYSICDYQIRT